MSVLFKACGGEYYGVPFGVSCDFCDDGVMRVDETEVGRWWWSDRLNAVCEGPMEMLTGRWDTNEEATHKYIKLLNKKIVE